METFTKLELEYLIAAVSSKFAVERDNHEGHDCHAVRVLNKVESEVTRVIRKWADPQ